MINAETHIIDHYRLFERLKAYYIALNPEFMTIDCETDGLVEKTCRLFGIGICFNTKKAFYIVWRDKTGQEVYTKEQQDEIKSWLLATASKSKVIGHNIVYDLMVLENSLSIDLTDYVHADTVLMKHTVNEEPPHNLKETAVSLLGPWADKAQQALKDNVIANGGRWVNDQKDMYMADTAILAEYCCWDVLLTHKLFEYFTPILKEQELEKLFYEDEIMPLYKNVTIPMKRNGFPIDVNYFSNLNTELATIINKLQEDIQEEIKDDIAPFISSLLNEEFPIKNSGNFPKAAAQFLQIPVPITKEGKVTLAAKALEKQLIATPQHEAFYNWIMHDTHACPAIVHKYLTEIQTKMWNDKYPEDKYIFNLKSNDHLGHYFTKVKGFKAELTETGKPKINAEFIEEVKSDDPAVQKLQDYKKLNKIKSTYVEGILERHVNGVIYTSWLQFGTTSGRFSSREPNLQNLPRIKEEDSGLSELVLKYVNAIKRGFVAPKGYKIVNADYSQLEPSVFAHMSGDEKLRDIFRNKLDLYSQVAIDVNKLEKQYSANKKAPNYLKTFEPELRQLWKIPTLGIVYGMEERRLMQSIECTFEEATKIIQGYLSTYPNLKKYMASCNISAKSKGMVRTEFGRIRHLPRAKELYNLYGNQLLDYKWAKAKRLSFERSEFKNLLNNSKNFPIQGLASHIVNRASIAIALAFKANNIDGQIRAQVHDEITTIVREDQVELAKKIIQNCMEKTTVISVPLSAEPISADNWSEAK